MAAVDDVWEHAQNTRTWLQTAADSLGRARSPGAAGFLASLLTRGFSRNADAGEAVDAIGKMKVAYLDLEYALPRAGRPPLPLQTLWLDVVRSDSFGRMQLNRAVVDQLLAALTADLAAIDSLIAEVERQQRQSRALEQR